MMIDDALGNASMNKMGPEMTSMLSNMPPSIPYASYSRI